MQKEFIGVTKCFKGGTPKPPKPPLPPAPGTAAENFAKSRIAERQRRAQGFSSTILGGFGAGGSDRPATVLKQLLGE